MNDTASVSESVSATAVVAGEKPLSNKGGAPRRNRNRMLHGLRCLTIGRGPANSGYAQALLYQFRRLLEQAVLDSGRPIGVVEAATIQTVVRLERHALLAQRWLREGISTMTPEQRLAYSREITSASQSRDRHLRLLGLGCTTRDHIWDAIHKPTLHDVPTAPETLAEQQDDSGDVQAPENAVDAAQEPQP